MPKASSYQEFVWALNDYRTEAIERKPIGDPEPLRGVPFPPWGTEMAEDIDDLKFRCDAWLDLAGFCQLSGDDVMFQTALVRAEQCLETIQAQNFKDTRIRRFLPFWLRSGNTGKALVACRTMASTENRIWALLILAEHFFAQTDGANGQAYLQEAEAAVDACPKSEDVFEGSARLGYWYLRSERPEQARPHFLKAMDVLPRLKTRDSRRRALAGAFSLLGDAATAAQLEAGIEDPKVQVDILTNKAWQAKNEDRLSEARALLEQALPIARAAKPPRKRLALEHQVITHFRGIGDLDRAEALAMAFEYPGARAKAFVAFAEQSFFDNENRARFLASAKREVGQMPEGKDRQDCQEAVDRLEEPFVASPEEESAFREMFGSE